MKSATGKEQKIQFGKMARKQLPLYRQYEEEKYSEGEQESWHASGWKVMPSIRLMKTSLWIYSVKELKLW